MPSTPVWDLSDEEFLTLVQSSKSKGEIARKLGIISCQAINKRLKTLSAEQLDNFNKKQLAKYKQLTLDELKILIDSSKTWIELCDKLGYSKTGDNINGLKEYLKEKNINFTHLPIGNQWQSSDAFKNLDRQKKPLEQLLNTHSKIDRGSLKNRLIKENKLANICASCKMEPIWNGQSLQLQLDHINGVNDDNRLENLRLLCPNCHSQTITYAGRNKKYQRELKGIFLKKKKCTICDKDDISGNQYCAECAKIHAPQSVRHVERPPLDQLMIDLIDTNYGKTGEKYGVSHTAIRKWINAYGRDPPNYGELSILRKAKEKLKGIKIQLTSIHENKNKIKVITLKNTHTCLDCVEGVPAESKYHLISQDKWIGTRPDLNQLIKDLIGTSYSTTGEKYGVSDEVIRNWIKTYDHDPPSDEQLELYRKATEKLKDVKIKLTLTYENENKIKGITLKKNIKNCSICGKEDIWGDKFCADCAKIHAPQSIRHVERPPLDQLIKDLIDTSYLKTGEKYGVSDNAIRKWIKSYGQNPPSAKQLELYRKSKSKSIKIQLKSN